MTDPHGVPESRPQQTPYQPQQSATAPPAAPPAGYAPPAPPAPAGYGMQPAYGMQPTHGMQTGRPGVPKSPGVVWILGIVTFGIYALVRHYTMNREMRDFSPMIQVSPGLAVLAFFLPFGGLISTINTSGRIRQAQAAAGLQPDCSGFVTFLCMFIAFSGGYQTSKLNQVWARVAQR